ncbi:MAG: MBOAT family protein, partial [Candidatus Omnitrophica bacterium]|nr:MBOAT family protein [Candidatus Omnitrophota bacterium]
YVLDCYHGRTRPLDNLFDYALYILLFPQLIAGPIVRFNEVAEQLPAEKRRLSHDVLLEGLLRFLIGLSKKVLLANALGEVVDAAFELPAGELGMVSSWVVIVAYAFQIYFDFSGYSDMAIGSARLLGVRFPENFRWPYAAVSPKDFWGRWHISLSSWIRDYLYLPLTGQAFRTSSRGGLEEASDAEASDLRRDRALVLTWFIMGLWHGAQWTFALWGLFHAFWV